MTYAPAPVPTDKAQWPLYLRSEFERIKAEFQAGFAQLTTLHVEPAKRRPGLTVLADGTDWDPGSGAGVYTWYAPDDVTPASWHKLG